MKRRMIVSLFLVLAFHGGITVPGYAASKGGVAQRGEASDIVSECVFLCSPATDYVNGVVLPVDGGWFAR